MAIGITRYTLSDRVNSTAWDLSIDDGTLKWVSGNNETQADPVFEDNAVPHTYWKLHINDGEIAIEDTLTYRDDTVLLDDTSTGQTYKLAVSNGEMYWTTDETAVFGWTPDYSFQETYRYNTIKSDLEGKIRYRFRQGRKRAWRLEFKAISLTECNDIYDFFKARRGSWEYFNWNHPESGTNVKVRFGDDSMTRKEVGPDAYNISTTLQEVF